MVCGPCSCFGLLRLNNTHFMSDCLLAGSVAHCSDILLIKESWSTKQLRSQCFWWHEQFCPCHRHIEIVQLFCLLRSLFVCLFVSTFWSALYEKPPETDTCIQHQRVNMSENIDIHVSLISALKTFWTWLDADELSVTSVTVVKLPSCPSRGVNASLQPVVHGGASLGRGLKTTLDGGNNQTKKNVCVLNCIHSVSFLYPFGHLKKNKMLINIDWRSF